MNNNNLFELCDIYNELISLAAPFRPRVIPDIIEHPIRSTVRPPINVEKLQLKFNSDGTLQIKPEWNRKNFFTGEPQPGTIQPEIRKKIVQELTNRRRNQILEDKLAQKTQKNTQQTLDSITSEVNRSLIIEKSTSTKAKLAYATITALSIFSFVLSKKTPKINTNDPDLSKFNLPPSVISSPSLNNIPSAELILNQINDLSSAITSINKASFNKKDSNKINQHISILQQISTLITQFNTQISIDKSPLTNLAANITKFDQLASAEIYKLKQLEVILNYYENTSEVSMDWSDIIQKSKLVSDSLIKHIAFIDSLRKLKTNIT